jgi:hypothetical protein
VTDSVVHGRQAAAAIAARGEQIKTGSAEYLWICRGVKPPLPPPDKPRSLPVIVQAMRFLKTQCAEILNSCNFERAPNYDDPPTAHCALAGPP